MPTYSDYEYTKKDTKMGNIDTIGQKAKGNLQQLKGNIQKASGQPLKGEISKLKGKANIAKADLKMNVKSFQRTKRV